MSNLPGLPNIDFSKLPPPDPAKIQTVLSVVDEVLTPLFAGNPAAAALHTIAVSVLHILLQADIKHAQDNPAQPSVNDPARLFMWQKAQNIMASAFHLAGLPQLDLSKLLSSQNPSKWFSPQDRAGMVAG